MHRIKEKEAELAHCVIVKQDDIFFPFYFSLVLINRARHADVLLRLEHLRMLRGMNSLEMYFKTSLL